MTLDWVLTPWVIVYTLAAHRLTRLLTHDSLPPIAKLRDYVTDRWGNNPWSEIAVCPWCMGWWVAVGTTILVSTPADMAYRWIAVPLAMSTVIGLVASRDG